MKFKVGGLTPDGGRRALPDRAGRGGPRLRAHGRRQPGLDAGRGDPLLAARRGPRPPLVRGAVRLVERPPRDARRPLRRRRPRVRRPERVLRRRLSRPDGRGRDRLLQLRLVVVGRPDGVAPGRRCGASPSTWRWPTTRSRRSPRTCSRRSRTARSSRCSAPSATRSGGTSSPTGRRSSTGCSRCRTGPGLGWELDARLHRGAPHPIALMTEPAGALRRWVRASRAAACSSRVRSGGIGAAVARAFAESGARVAATDLSGTPRRPTSRRRSPVTGHVGIGADLGIDRPPRGSSSHEAEEAVGPLVALAHLAAVLRRKHEIVEIDEADWDAQVDVNFKASFFLNRAFAERLRGGGAARGDRQLQLAGVVDGRLRRLGRLQRDEGRDRHDDAGPRAHLCRGRDPRQRRRTGPRSTRRC